MGPFIRIFLRTFSDVSTRVCGARPKLLTKTRWSRKKRAVYCRWFILEYFPARRRLPRENGSWCRGIIRENATAPQSSTVRVWSARGSPRTGLPRNGMPGWGGMPFPRWRVSLFLCKNEQNKHRYKIIKRHSNKCIFSDKFSAFHCIHYPGYVSLKQSIFLRKIERTLHSPQKEVLLNIIIPQWSMINDQ